MTKEEIFELEGRVLDAAVAKQVMGWEGVKVYDGLKLSGFPNSKHIYAKEVPRYSSDIAAAWEVVEKMRQCPGVKGCKACIEIHGTDFNGDGTEDEFDQPYWAHIHGSEAGGQTAPLAICRAALLVVQ